MSEITEVKAVFQAEDHASAVVRGIRRDVDRLAKSFASLARINIPALKASPMQAGADKVAQAFTQTEAAAMRALRSRFAFESRMGHQRAAEDRAQERERRAVEAATLSDFRRRMAFTTRMSRQQAREAEQAERTRQRTDAAAERDAAATQRRRVADTRYLFSVRQRHERQEQRERDRAHRDLVSGGRDAWGRGRDAVRNVVRPAGVTAIAGTAAAGAAARRILGAESRIDAAEINTRSYGGLSADAARSLRDQWAAPLAEQLGAQADKLLTAWTDAVKLGVPAAGAKSFSELSTKTSEAWEVPFEQVADIFGTINTLLTSKGEAFDIKRLQSVANSIQHLAAKQSTTPEKLISFLQRGAGAAQVLGMSQEAGLAFGSASTSLGNQAGQSGRLFDYIASRIIEMPRLTKQHGQEGDQARKLVRALGYGSAEAMDRKRRANPDSFLPDFMSRFNKIRNPKSQDQAIRFFTGREWLGEFGRMIKGVDTYKEAVKLEKEANGLDAIGAVWELHRTKLAFVFKQFRAGWLNILGEFGKILSPMARQAGDYFLKWTAQLRAGGLAERFKASVEGLVNGLGFRDLPALLKGMFGEPGQGAAGAIESWRAAARGFGAGIRDVVDLVVGSLRRLSGGTGDPEVMARWTARLLTFSAAMVIAGPAITALGGITSAIVALGTAAAATWTAMRVGALVSGPAAAGAGAAVALRAVVGRLLGGVGLAIGAELGARRGEIVTALLGAMRGVWGDLVAALKADFAEWSREGVLRGVLRSLDPNLTDRVDPKNIGPNGKVIREPDADVPGWRRALDWLRGADRLKTRESIDTKPSSKAESPPAWRDPPRKSAPAGINVLDAIKGSLAPKVPTVELPDAGPTVVPTITVPAPVVRVPVVPSLTVPAPVVPRITAPAIPPISVSTPNVPPIAVPRPEMPALVVPRIPAPVVPEAARPTVPPIAAPHIVTARAQTVAATAPQLLMPSPAENGNFDFGPIVRAISGLSALDVLRMIASTSAAILADLRRRSRQTVERQDGEGEIAPASLLRGDAVDAVDRLGRTMSAENARLQLAAFTAPSRTAVAGFSGPNVDGAGAGGGGFNAAGPGGPSDPAKAFGRNFFTPGSSSPKAPSWFGTTPKMDPTGNPASMPGPQGPIGDRMKSVYQAYRNAGLSHEAAKSFAAEIGRENGYRENLLFGKHTDPHNGKTNAGMMSWQGDRATKLLSYLRERGQLNADGSIKRTQESLDAQAQFSLDEMKSGALGAKGQRALGVLNNPNASHADRALALGDDVIKWRQHDPTYAHHKGIRDRYYAQLGGLTDANAGRTASLDPSAGVGGQGAPGAGIVGTGTGPQPADFGGRLAQLRASGAISNAQCVALAKAWVGANGASVTTWRKGDAVTGGNIAPGTPIATFLNRDGSQSNRYAGGGTGTPGANLDHAGIFHSYLTDKDGKRVGMKMLDQWNGRNGAPQLRDYYYGDRRGGEKDASKYFAVKDQDGSYLGGGRNPMNGRAVADGVPASPGAQLAPSAVAQGVVDGFRSTGWKPSGSAAAAAASSAPAKAAVDGFTSTGWRNGMGGDADAIRKALAPSEARPSLGPDPKAAAGATRVLAPDAGTLAKGVAPSAGELAKAVPAPERRASVQDGSAASGSRGGSPAPAFNIHINGSNATPQELAGQIQRHVTEAWNFRSHDLEPELT